MNRLSRMACRVVVGLVGCICFSVNAQAGSIVLVGYWPPTNEMLRPFSSNPDQNPEGWVGQNWKGLGHDVHAFFPQFPPDGNPFNDSFGSEGFIGSPESDFRVDYQDTSADFWAVMDLLDPVGVITFSWGGGDDRWEIERVEGGHSGGSTAPFDWIEDGNGEWYPTQDSIDSRSWDAISTYRNGNQLQSQLPIDNIFAATTALGLADVFIDETDTSGNYLSGFLALHGLYYNSLNNSNLAAGHIHVGSGLSVAHARSLAEVTLQETLLHINSPSPVPESGSTLLPALGLAGLALFRRRCSTNRQTDRVLR